MPSEPNLKATLSCNEQLVLVSGELIGHWTFANRLFDLPWHGCVFTKRLIALIFQ